MSKIGLIMLGLASYGLSDVMPSYDQLQLFQGQQSLNPSYTQQQQQQQGINYQQNNWDVPPSSFNGPDNGQGSIYVPPQQQPYDYTQQQQQYINQNNYGYPAQGGPYDVINPQQNWNQNNYGPSTNGGGKHDKDGDHNHNQQGSQFPVATSTFTYTNIPPNLITLSNPISTSPNILPNTNPNFNNPNPLQPVGSYSPPFAVSSTVIPNPGPLPANLPLNFFGNSGVSYYNTPLAPGQPTYQLPTQNPYYPASGIQNYPSYQSGGSSSEQNDHDHDKKWQGSQQQQNNNLQQNGGAQIYDQIGNNNNQVPPSNSNPLDQVNWQALTPEQTAALQNNIQNLLINNNQGVQNNNNNGMAMHNLD